MFKTAYNFPKSEHIDFQHDFRKVCLLGFLAPQLHFGNWRPRGCILEVGACRCAARHPPRASRSAKCNPPGPNSGSERLRGRYVEPPGPIWDVIVCGDIARWPWGQPAAVGGRVLRGGALYAGCGVPAGCELNLPVGLYELDLRRLTVKAFVINLESR